jgi:hypothetical protein
MAMATWAAALALAAQGPTDPGAMPLAAGRRALEAGKRDEAAGHLLEACARSGPGAQVLELLARAAEGDADAVALWTQALADGTADARGRVKLPEEVVRLAGKDTRAPALAEARAAAVQELVKQAGARERKGAKAPEELLVARHLRRLARELAEDAPALFAAHADELDPRLAAPPGAPAAVAGALERELGQALASHRLADAVRVALALRGLARQAGLDDLQGGAPPPGMAAVEKRAAEALARAREELAHAQPAPGEPVDEAQSWRPWTVAELEALADEGDEACDAFTRAHADWSHPGRALSPGGRYLVETVCGFETLLGVASTIELHHARLAGFFGRDPFAERRGTVRIVPEASGLEAEGAPFWWAGGFQSGDVTTVRFSVGSLDALGHGLTHELTHRFDGELCPGQMSWLTEGKAVWTGAAFGGADDQGFVENHASFGTLEHAWIKGYGAPESLAKLVEGTIEDYRDNYFAGYALYVFLTTYEEAGRKPFAGRMADYAAGGERGNKDPMAWFVRAFADGKDGRPATFEELAKRFEVFAGGFYWRDRQPFTERYTEEVPATGRDELVLDAPTWSWERERAEPALGQGQALIAARLLRDLGADRDALAAYVLALAQDGRTPAAERELAELCEGLGARDAAWALRAELAGAAPGAPELTPAPFKLPDTAAFLRAQADAAQALAAAGEARAAAALGADRDRAARALGLPALGLARPAGDSPRHPFDRPAEPLGAFVEDGLTHYDELRQPGLWYLGADGSLSVGRAEARSTTGTMDRAAYQRDAFARSERWILPGSYAIAADVRLTTSFVDAAVVLGYTRRDRGVRVVLSAGDFLYSVGGKDEAPEIKSVSFRVDGLFPREGALPGALPGGQVDLGRPVSSFRVELLVDGPTLAVAIDGQVRGTYCAPDGVPLEGCVGFATSMGAIEVARPTVRRLDRARWAPPTAAAAAPAAPPWNRPYAAASAPPPNGLLVLRLAQPDDAEQGYPFDPANWVAKALRAAVALDELRRRGGVLQDFELEVSEQLAGEPLTNLRAALEQKLGRTPPVRLYARVPPPAGEGPEARALEKDLDTDWLLLIDPAGVVRVREPFSSWGSAFSHELARWLAALRENGFPPRALPPLSRPAPEGAGG